jgi:hypothetical protein
MAAFDTVSGAALGTSTSWFLKAQTEVGWGTTPNMVAGTVYRLRAYDSGTEGYVYWTNTGTSPDLSPVDTDTTPNYTGTLSLKSVL